MVFTKEKMHKSITMLGLGFLVFLSGGSFVHEIKESPSFDMIFVSVILVFLAVLVANKFAKHFSHGCDHTHSTDKIFIGSIILASFVHTTFDGGILHLTLREEGVAQMLALVALLFVHEFLRMSTLMNILKDMGYKSSLRWIYVFSVSVVGFFFGIVLSQVFGSILGEWEGLIHLITGFLYAIIATDIYLFIKSRYEVNYILVSAGFFIAMFLEVFHAH